jgi:hypothetical protein
MARIATDMLVAILVLSMDSNLSTNLKPGFAAAGVLISAA